MFVCVYVQQKINKINLVLGVNWWRHLVAKIVNGGAI